MRQVKFRGKRIDDGEWIYGYLADVQEQYGYATINYDFDDGEERWESCDLVDVNTVGQYTGLHDKNCKEIYEGDVLKNNLSDKPFGVVTWHNDGYFFIDCGFGEFPINANGYRPLGEMLILKIDNVKDVFFEVIGNIHEK